MKLFIVFAVALVSFSSFADHFEGRGKENEDGIEVCEMNVTSLGNGKLKLEIFALGEEFHVVIPQNSKEFVIKTSTIELPKAKMKGHGFMMEGKPVSFEVQSTRRLEGHTFQESSTCNF